MLFCSPIFLIFFLVYLLLWFLVPVGQRLWLIIVGSLFFYGYWNWNYLIIPVELTLVSYYGGKWISYEKCPKTRTFKLILCTLILLIPLLIFKYLNFFSQREIVTFGLPLGISYISFTLVAYMVDVARDTYPAENRFSWLLAHVTYFPQLIAGPILRPKELLPQLKQNLPVSGILRWQAFTIFTCGLAKKLIIADQLKPYVDYIYNTLDSANTLQGLIGYYLYPAQIYCDSSGYADMAIGLALFFGIQLPINFNRPFLSESTTKLWRRWHITLSFWFRDYVYFPMTGKKANNILKLSNKFFTMVLCGFWHSASWTFIFWGAFNGILLCIEHPLKNTRWPGLLPKAIKALLTFHLFAFGVIFIRAQNVSQAFALIKSFTVWSNPGLPNIGAFTYPLLLCVLLYLSHPWDHIDSLKNLSDRLNPFLLTTLLASIWILALILSSTSGGSSKFIYFDF